jgi:hypothetical protein
MAGPPCFLGATTQVCRREEITILRGTLKVVHKSRRTLIFAKDSDLRVAPRKTGCAYDRSRGREGVMNRIRIAVPLSRGCRRAGWLAAAALFWLGFAAPAGAQGVSESANPSGFIAPEYGSHSYVQPDTVYVPASSVARPEDAGKFAHTDYVIANPNREAVPTATNKPDRPARTRARRRASTRLSAASGMHSARRGRQTYTDQRGRLGRDCPGRRV